MTIVGNLKRTMHGGLKFLPENTARFLKNRIKSPAQITGDKTGLKNPARKPGSKTWPENKDLFLFVD